MTRYGGAQLNGDLCEVRLVELKKTCESCPAQWEGRTVDGEFFYARARHGRFSATIAGVPERAVDSAPFVAGTIQSISQHTLGYVIDDEPSTAELLKMCGADLFVAAPYHTTPSPQLKPTDSIEPSLDALCGCGHDYGSHHGFLHMCGECDSCRGFHPTAHATTLPPP